MKIGIVGAGNVGRALGERWAAGEHEVVYGVRDPAGAAEAGAGRPRSASVREAARFGQVIVLATPWRATRDALRAAGDLAGKILVDCTNPLNEDLSGLAIGHTTSAGEEVARWAPGASVVKCFNNIGAQHMRDPRASGGQASMFYCGDDATAKRLVAALGAELGFDMVDAGPLAQARLLEPLAMLWISLAYQRGLGPGIAFKLLRR